MFIPIFHEFVYNEGFFNSIIVKQHIFIQEVWLEESWMKCSAKYSIQNILGFNPTKWKIHHKKNT
jgi:hypothetical protein